ncbi:DUF2513 domain-containing protein [Cronobacter malonaticus]|uniref:DUF2513 domain-containing protein n=1 Tax=Cronobacter TaxID=413496 RepID=UPI000517CCA3|nr:MULTISPECIES: DUF2513 domain-containing protein [Cronobacter]ELY2772359.1 DUF2513 domain-containing protein [Cronobacter sakazakii]EMD9271577.1 DUF2513 domain-containing protein [Cronobacter malonaticus]KIU62716.1 hypothetical protein CRSA0334_12400 [Cronobacter malonaticus ENBT0334]MDT3563019.1 DUF2513 domain-containing protein [Cronobacter malonaticus]TQQ92839.1 DUF2513 domain-containing protein [Cronobacter sakazakii]
MKINQDYIKELLCAFEDTEGPDTLLTELEAKGYNRDDSDFIFHMRLLADNKLIERVDGRRGFGHLIRCSLSDHVYYWMITPLRLTAKGHDFLSDIRQKEVWSAIKTNFKEQGLATLTSVAKSLAEGFAKKKVRDITGIDI